MTSAFSWQNSISLCPASILLQGQICLYPRCFFGEGNGTALQYSCLENPMDGGAWKAEVHGVAEGWTRLSDFTFTFHFHALEKEMAVFLPGESRGRRSLVGCRLWGHTESDTTEVLAAAAARCFLTSYFCIPVPYNEKDIFFGC